MGTTVGIGNRVGGGNNFSWSSYWAQLISATVEDAAPTEVVLTFPSAKPALVASDFTIAGFTVDSASWNDAVLTLVLSTAVAYGDSIVVTFTKGTGLTTTATNNVSAEAELTTYITGLTTPLSSAQKIKTNNFIRSIKSGMSITNLSDVFDTIWLLGGETSESSLKNLVKDAHHCSLQGATVPSFEENKGFQGNGSTGYLDTNYNPRDEGENYTVNSASFGWYSFTNSLASACAMGARDGASSNRSFALTRYTGEFAQYGINQNSVSANAPVIAANSSGLFIANRVSSNGGVLYRENEVYLSVNIASSNVPDRNCYICGYNNAGSLGSPSARRKGFGFYGRGLTADERTVLRNALLVFFSLI